jgi:hypothetical protein
MANLTGKTLINTPQGAMTVREAVEKKICEIKITFNHSHDETYGNCIGLSPRWKRDGRIFFSENDAQNAIYGGGTKVVKENNLKLINGGYYGCVSDRTAESLMK